MATTTSTRQPTPDVSGSTLKRVAAMSLFLAILKGAAFLLSGSLVVLASALDSLSDAFVSLMNFRMSRFAKNRPDKEHPFGHGGFEVLSSLIQGVMIAGFAFFLLLQAIDHLTGRAPPEVFEQADLYISIGVLLFSAVFGLVFAKLLRRAEQRANENQERSLSVVADKAHYAGDALYNLLSAVGLVIVLVTGIGRLDAAFAIVGALLMGKSSFDVFRQVIGDILHGEAPLDLQRQILALAKSADPRIQSVHRLRTRRSGPTLFIDFHMTMPSEMTLEEAHFIGERAAGKIRKEIPGVDVLIHLDPDSEPDDELWDPQHE